MESNASFDNRFKAGAGQKTPLPAETVQNLQEDFLIRSTYHSNAIEGNTLTVYETKAILEDGITIGSRSMLEHLKAINHREAMLCVKSLLDTALTENVIQNIHHIILRGIDSAGAGVYRNRNVLITGASHQTTPPFHVPEAMPALVDWYENETRAMHPVEAASRLHSRFINIHPFLDGNERTARLLMNLELKHHGYLPVLIPVEQRQDYYKALDKAGISGDDTQLMEMIAQQEKERRDQYLQVLVSFLGGRA